MATFSPVSRQPVCRTCWNGELYAKRGRQAWPGAPGWDIQHPPISLICLTWLHPDSPSWGSPGHLWSHPAPSLGMALPGQGSGLGLVWLGPGLWDWVACSRASSGSPSIWAGHRLWGLTRFSRAPGCVKGVLWMCQVCTCGPQGRQSRVWSSPQSCVHICCSEPRLLWSSVERGAVQSRAF